MSAMEKAIILTSSYFSIFSFPLTVIELWQGLYWTEVAKPDFSEFNDSLKKLIEKKVIQNNQGFLCLSGHEDAVASRQQNYRDSFKKYELARRICRVISFIPFVKAIYICNSLAYNNSRINGDIDLFIVCQPQRLWLTRLLSVGLLKMFKMRPTQNTKQNKIDPTFFISSDNLKLESVLNNGDIYLLYWLSQLAPIYDPENILAKIIEANQNILNKLPNSLAVMPLQRRVVNNNFIIRGLRWLINIFINYNYLEVQVKNWQLKIMPIELKNKINLSTDVMITEQIIKLHKNDRRREYAKKWQTVSADYFQLYES